MVVDSEVDAGRFMVPGGPRGSLGANVRFLSQSDQGGRPGGLQIMVTHGHAFVGQSDGVTVVDVRDPRQPRAVCRIPAPSGSWTPHLQTHGDLLLVAEELNFYHHQPDEADYYMHSIPGLHPGMFGQRGTDFGAGMSVYDISVPELPRKIGSLAVEGFGLKRLWYDGGRYAYASAIMDGFIDHILVVIDMDVPSRPELVGQWWLPGMWAAGGEVPTWSNRVALHHALVADGYAYGAWRDGGLTVLDLADPTRPTLTRHLNWCPPFGGGTHSPLPLPDRDLLVVGDEAVLDNCEDGIKRVWVFDIRCKASPVSISTFPSPGEQDYPNLGGHFGPHNLHENRLGSYQSSTTIFATYQNAGVRVFDLHDPFQPRQTAFFVPAPPAHMVETRPGRPLVAHTADVFVDPNGLMYATDYNAGLHILEYTPK
jgi:hypothetical protein